MVTLTDEEVKEITEVLDELCEHGLWMDDWSDFAPTFNRASALINKLKEKSNNGNHDTN